MTVLRILEEARVRSRSPGGHARRVGGENMWLYERTEKFRWLFYLFFIKVISLKLRMSGEDGRTTKENGSLEVVGKRWKKLAGKK